MPQMSKKALEEMLKLEEAVLDFSAGAVSKENSKVSEKAKGLKFDDGKAPLDLLSPKAMTEVAKVMAFGAKKYDKHNWRNGLAWSRLVGAALRHIEAFNDGQDKDPETGLSHIAHASCCLMFLLEYEQTHPELDDRYKAPETK